MQGQSEFSILEQRNRLSDIFRSNANIDINEGDRYFVCSSAWIHRFRRYIDFDNLDSTSGEGSFPNENDEMHPGTFFIYWLVINRFQLAAVSMSLSLHPANFFHPISAYTLNQHP